MQDLWWQSEVPHTIAPEQHLCASAWPIVLLLCMEKDFLRLMMGDQGCYSLDIVDYQSVKVEP